MVAPSQLLSADSDATPITDTTSIKAPSAAIDLLSGDSAGLISRQVGSELATLADNLSIAPPSAPEERPATPAKDPAFTAVMSPPPPSPPPKDVPPKDVPPKDLPPKDAHLLAPELYLDLPPSRPASPMPSIPTKSQASSDDENDGTSSVIHDLFQKSHRAFVAEEQHSVSSPSSSLPSLTSVHPPRSSSLEATPEPLPPAPPPRPQATSTAKSQNTPHRPPPPDEDLPFDFHRFLSQLRHRSADPVAKFLRSFLSEFAKKQWMVHEQVKIVRDFLTFIYAKMDLCEVWREVGDGEMDNAMEGMEKLVMNRLYTQTFSPAIQPHDGVSRVDERFPGRRGQHQEDVERDEILTQKVRIYSWVREEHLDIGNTVSGDGGRKFLDLAVKEMRKIGTYRAPRDKVICVLNCCKVIFGL